MAYGQKQEEGGIKLGIHYWIVEGLLGYRGCSRNGLAILYHVNSPPSTADWTREDICSKGAQSEFFHWEFSVRTWRRKGIRQRDR